MFTQIIVPLDGSRRAASAFVLATALARMWHCRVTLIGVEAPAPRVRGLWRARVPDGDDAFDLPAYLGDCGAMLRQQDICVSILVRRGDPAAEILAVANDADDALLVLTTHGWSGNMRAPLGAVARRVVKRAAVPTLLIRTDADATINPVATIMDVTMTLDGSEAAEAALSVAAQFARVLAAPLTLLHVIADAFFTARLFSAPDESNYMLQDEIDDYHRRREQRAMTYLVSLAMRVRFPGLAVRFVVTRSVTNHMEDGFALYLAERPSGLMVVTDANRSADLWWGAEGMAARALKQMPRALLIMRTASVRDVSDGGENAPALADARASDGPSLRLVPSAYTSRTGERAQMLSSR
jgi:nucleotide-binding universal stress UspA family protein